MKIVEENNFEEEIKEGVSLVDFFATWCGPCRIMGGILDDIKEEIGDKVNIFKVDTDNCEKLTAKFGIMSIPTLIIFKDGVMQEKHIGVWQKEDAIEAVEKYL